MKIKIDEAGFDNRQYALTVEIVKTIKHILKEKKISDDEAYDITEDVAFSVCAIIDSGKDMYVGDKPLFPVLAFVEDEDSDELLVGDKGSWLHEYVHAILDDIFDEEEEEHDDDYEPFQIRFLKNGKDLKDRVLEPLFSEWSIDSIVYCLSTNLAILNQIETKDLVLNKSIKDCGYRFLDFDSIMIEGAFYYMINENDGEFKNKFLELGPDYSIEDLALFIYEKVKSAQKVQSNPRKKS